MPGAEMTETPQAVTRSQRPDPTRAAHIEQPWKPSFGRVTQISPRMLLFFGVVLLGFVISYFFFSAHLKATAPNAIAPSAPPTIAPQQQINQTSPWYNSHNNSVAGLGSPQPQHRYRPGETPPPLPPPGGNPIPGSSQTAISPAVLSQYGTAPSGSYAVPSVLPNSVPGYAQPIATPTPHRMTVAFIQPRNATLSAETGVGIQPTPQPIVEPTPGSSEDYAPGQLQNPRSQFELQAGSVIPAALAGNISSDLAGTPRAVVSEPVYDSISQRYLLIPAGSKLIGSYAQGSVYGQNRLFIVWNRLFLPDGRYLDLGGMQSTDQSGASGLNANVDQHNGNKFGNVLLLSALQAALDLGTRSTSNNSSGTTIIVAGQPSLAQTVGQSTSTQLTNLGTALTQQALSQAPTLSVSAGARFNIAVEKDIVFPGPYNAQ